MLTGSHHQSPFPAAAETGAETQAAAVAAASQYEPGSHPADAAAGEQSAEAPPGPEAGLAPQSGAPPAGSQTKVSTENIPPPPPPHHEESDESDEDDEEEETADAAANDEGIAVNDLVASGRLELCQLSKLLQCIRNKDLRMIESMSKLGVPHLFDYCHPTEGETTLGLAASMNDEQMLEFLLSLGADPNAVDGKGRSAAMRASEFGHVQSMRVLVNAGTDMSIRDEEGKGILFYCIAPTKRHFECAEIALENGADVNNTTRQGTPLLTFASETAKTNEDLCLALLKHGADPSIADAETNRTAAMAAASSGSARVLKALLEISNNVDELMVPVKVHALHEAAKNGHLEVIQVMAGFGANFDQITDKAYSSASTPIHTAAQAGMDKVILLLASRGTNALAKNKENKTAKVLAKELGFKPCVKACKKAEKFTKSKSKPAPWLLKLHDFCFIRDEELFSAFAEFDANKKGLIKPEQFFDVLRGAGAPLPEDEALLDPILANHTVDKMIQYNVFLGGRKLVPKKYHMLTFEPKVKKAKKQKKVKGKTPPIPICLLPEIHADRAFVPLHANFTDFSRFDRDHPPTHPLHDDSAWYMERPQPTKVKLQIAVHQNDKPTIADAIDKKKAAKEAEKAAAAAEAAAAQGKRKGSVPPPPVPQVNAPDQYYKSPLAIAAAMGNLELVKMLVESGANVNQMDNFYWTPLHLAAHSGVKSVVEYLLDHGAKLTLDAPSMTGATPLMKAIESCNPDIVQMLFDRGAKVRVEDMASLSPLEVAACYGDWNVYSLVRAKLDSLPPVKEEAKKPKDKKGTQQRKPPFNLKVPTPPKPDIRQQALSVLPPVPFRYRSDILDNVTSLNLDRDETEDVSYVPTQVWTEQPTSEQLMEQREERRRQYGWMIDFEDYKRPFRQNIATRLANFAEQELQDAARKKKTAKRK